MDLCLQHQGSLVIKKRSLIVPAKIFLDKHLLQILRKLPLNFVETFTTQRQQYNATIKQGTMCIEDKNVFIDVDIQKRTEDPEYCYTQPRTKVNKVKFLTMKLLSIDFKTLHFSSLLSVSFFIKYILRAEFEGHLKLNHEAKPEPEP